MSEFQTILIYLCIFVNFCCIGAYGGECSECVECLFEQSYGTDYKRTDEYLRIDQGMCPEKCSEEYRCLQQIEYMYRGKTIPSSSMSDIPCSTECLHCTTKIRQTTCGVQPLKKNYLETMFDGIFFSNVNSYNKTRIAIKPKSTPDDHSRPRPTNSYTRPFSPRVTPGVITTTTKRPLLSSFFNFTRHRTAKYLSKLSQRPRTKRDTSSGCGTITAVTPFLDTLVDIDGTWHSIWFNSTSFSCQYYEAISCPGTGCSLHNTIRSFLVTSARPHGTYGHSFTLFNHYLLHNVKFKNVYVSGYCEKHSP